jgi:hypothetical protein
MPGITLEDAPKTATAPATNVRHSTGAGSSCACAGCAGSRAQREANGPTQRRSKKRG